MNKGVDFFITTGLTPPYTAEGPNIYGRSSMGLIAVVAYMWDYYSVSSEQQRLMAENTVALCYLKYEQEVANA